MTKLRTVFAATALLFFLQLSNTAKANHIDFMVDGAFFLNTDSTTGLVMATQIGEGGNIIGGERDIAIDFISGSGFANAGTLGASPGTGPVGPDNSIMLQLSNSVSAVGRFELTYDGVGTAGLGGADFDTNWDSIAVDFAAVQGAGDLTLAVSDTSSGSGSLTLPVMSAGMVTFPFADGAYSGVDFTSVDSVKFTLDTTETASDFAISSITREVIPEPTAALLAAFGLLGLSVLRQSKRN